MSEPAMRRKRKATNATTIEGAAGTVLSGSFSGPVTIVLGAAAPVYLW